jgi:hypothetical protein
VISSKPVSGPPDDAPKCFPIVGSEVAHQGSPMLATVRRSNRACRFPAHGFHEDANFREAKKGINRTCRLMKGPFLAPVGLIQSTSLLGRERTGFSLKELFRPPSSLLIWFPFSVPTIFAGCLSRPIRSPVAR